MILGKSHPKDVAGWNAIDAADAEAPGFCLLNLTKLQSYRSYKMLQEARTNLPSWVPLTSTHPTSSRTQTILDWINLNLFKPRHFRQDHLLICGPPLIGKSSLINVLSERARIYSLPHENFFGYYNDDDYDLIVYDEVAPGLSGRDPNTLQAFLDGKPMIFRTKGGQGFKRSNLPAILLTNYSMEALFPKDEVIRDTFSKRFVIVDYRFTQETIPWEHLQYDETNKSSSSSDPPSSPLLD